jgi:hypothetical protein
VLRRTFASLAKGRIRVHRERRRDRCPEPLPVSTNKGRDALADRGSHFDVALEDLDDGRCAFNNGLEADGDFQCQKRRAGVVMTDMLTADTLKL